MIHGQLAKSVTKIIDIAVLFDANVASKEDETLMRYEELAGELKRIWLGQCNTCGGRCTRYNVRTFYIMHGFAGYSDFERYHPESRDSRISTYNP